MKENRRILVVDDSPSIHEDFRKILVSPERTPPRTLIELESRLFQGADARAPQSTAVDLAFGFEIDFAFQGLEGIRKVESALAEGKPYAIVFMDVRMPPGIDGITAIEKVWEIAPDTEMVICTAFSDYPLEQIQERLGRSDRLLILKKPFEYVEIRQMALALSRKWNLSRELNRYLDHVEDVLRERTTQLEKQREITIQNSKMAALGQMAGGVAHEINTPLGAINMIAGRLKKKAATRGESFKDVAQNLDSIEKATHRIAEIVRGLLEISREPEHVQLERIDIEKLISTTYGICQQKFASKGVRVDIDLASGLHLQGRAAQLSQVVLSLLNNTIDAVESLSDKWVRIESRLAGGQVEISVIDSGAGIASEHREKVFEPFFTTKDIRKGTGLGLSTSFGIIRDHGGILFLDSNSPNTRFVIRIPASPKGQTSDGQA